MLKPAAAEIGPGGLILIKELVYVAMSQLVWLGLVEVVIQLILQPVEAVLALFHENPAGSPVEEWLDGVDHSDNRYQRKSQASPEVEVLKSEDHRRGSRKEKRSTLDGRREEAEAPLLSSGVPAARDDLLTQPERCFIRRKP
jgi:hypothetical protein